MTQDHDGFERLRYRGADGWVALPEWSRFMLDLGWTAARFRAEGARLVVAVSVPTRSFAAALAGTAAVISRFTEDGGIAEGSEHFLDLATLPEGTAVMVRTRNSTQQGHLLGMVTDPAYGSSPLIAVEMPKQTRILLPEKGCERIQVIEAAADLQVRRRRLVRDPEFVERALPAVDMYALSSRTRLDCVIVGTQHALEYELVREHFAAGSGALDYHQGSLQGIARVRQFGGPNDPYRAAVMSASAEPDERVPAEPPPALAVFDGATAFNNWRSAWPASNWLVVIDRSSPSIDDAAASINQAYAVRLSDSDAFSALEVPAGVELMAYLERR